MASRLADAHAALYAALAPVLPGRVDPYPPALGRVVAPKVWIGDEETVPATIGSNTTVTLVRFPVVIVYDGAVHAQVAGLHDLVSAVLDAVDAAAGFDSDGSRPGLPLDVPLDSTLRGRVVTATATITARTLCPTTPTTATIPSTPLEAADV
jgi:hypothetical protein